jgi:hypothetical protein
MDCLFVPKLRERPQWVPLTEPYADASWAFKLACHLLGLTLNIALNLFPWPVAIFETSS